MGSIITVDGYKFSKLESIYHHESIEFFFHQKEFMKEYRISHDGLLPHTLFVDYLRIKYEIDPYRFTKYHPIVGRWFKKEAEVHTVISIPNPPPISITTVGVPEPGSFRMLALAICLFAVYFVVFRVEK